MLELYRLLKGLAESEFADIVSDAPWMGGSSADPNKLRLVFKDNSFMDVWLSEDGDYAYHWERRRQDGTIYRWDNAPHHPEVPTFPEHFHDGEENVVASSELSANAPSALREVLLFVRRRLGE